MGRKTLMRSTWARRGSEFAGVRIALTAVAWRPCIASIGNTRRCLDRLTWTDTAPDQDNSGHKQKTQHDITEIIVAERVIGPCAEPCADDR